MDENETPELFDTSELFVNMNEPKFETAELKWNTEDGPRLVKVKYKSIPWALYNQLVKEAFIETANDSEEFERVKQMKILKHMVVEVAGKPMTEDMWASLDHRFGEALRMMFFQNTGEFRIPKEVLKNLMMELRQETGNI